MAQVELTRHLKDIFPALKQAPFTVSAATVADVVAELERTAPGVGFYICDERGRLRQHVNIFIGDEMICDRGKLSDRVEADSRVFIAQALSGG
jgi:ABC-type nitrate/sulfonate/bicarbonate transport system permease component